MQTSTEAHRPKATASPLDTVGNTDATAICQDGVRVTRSQLREWASTLAQLLSSRGKGRVAISSPRADRVAAAILAAHWANYEILLLRSNPSRDLCRAWGISGLIDENFRVEPMEGNYASEGFQVLLTTSGTTGEPKIARHTLTALLGRVRPRPRRYGPARWLLAFHPASFAGLQVLLTALTSRDELIAVSELSVIALKHAALDWLPTHLSATPTFWRSFLVAAGDALSKVPLSQLTLGGEVADQRTINHLRAAFPTSRIVHIYATTEAGAVFSVKDGLAGFPVQWLKTGVEGARLRITDGILEVQSPCAMTGYLAAGGKAFTDDGWLRTGDLVTILDDRVHFLGRADTVISVGGAKVTPEEVEHMLLQVPGVLDSRVFGLPSVITGSVVATEIVTEVSDHDGLRRAIIAHLRGRLEAHKIPRIVRFVPSIPVSQSGKKRRCDAVA